MHRATVPRVPVPVFSKPPRWKNDSARRWQLPKKKPRGEAGRVDNKGTERQKLSQPTAADLGRGWSYNDALQNVLDDE